MENRLQYFRQKSCLMILVICCLGRIHPSLIKTFHCLGPDGFNLDSRSPSHGSSLESQVCFEEGSIKVESRFSLISQIHSFALTQSGLVFTARSNQMLLSGTSLVCGVSTEAVGRGAAASGGAS